MIPSPNWDDVPTKCKSAWQKIEANLYENGYSSILCPCCKEGVLRVYWHAYSEISLHNGTKQRKGGGWMWCPVCHSYEHWSGLVPHWWPIADLISPDSELYHDPRGLDEQWSVILQRIAQK